MTQESDAEVYENLLDARESSDTEESVEFDLKTGGTIELNVRLLEREERWDFMSRLPDGMFEAAEDEDEDGEPVPTTGSKIPDGDAAMAMEDITVTVCSHPNFADPEIRHIAEEIQDEDLFSFGMNILDKSMERGQVDGFRFNQ